ncbi:MAG TPA: hypothetical protein VEQ40_08520, partial [Pyrinomonadaceae bacterium]|nr:hypothetical protein [Pyrinomonadaceae bacterium]
MITEKNELIKAETRAYRKQKRVRRGTSVQMDNGTGELIVGQEQVIETSIEQAEARQIIDTLARTYRNTVEQYKAWGETAEAAHAHAESTEERCEVARSKPPADLTWWDISVLAAADVEEGMRAWDSVRELADNELLSGMRSARIVSDGSPLERARYIVVRESFRVGWKPQNGIEEAMIEMLAETFSLFQYWTEIAHQRVIRRYDEQRKDVARYEGGGWKSPYQSEVEAVEQAHVMSERYNRMFLRTLRQMRDLRRYTPPVIVNNGGQVNVAANGGQQVNLQ